MARRCVRWHGPLQPRPHTRLFDQRVLDQPRRQRLEGFDRIACQRADQVRDLQFPLKIDLCRLVFRSATYQISGTP